MTGTLTATAGVTAGGVTTASVGVPSSHVCQVPGSITFASARSFVEPTPGTLTVLAATLVRLGISSPLNQLLISGHTDLVGSASANLALSNRRTAAVRAVLHDDAAAWESVATTENWAAPEFGAMVVAVGDAPAGDAAKIAAAVAAVSGPAHVAARAALFHRYVAVLLAGTPVPAITEATPATLGCGQSQPLRGSAAAPSRDPALPPITGDFRPNRRVELYFTDGAAPLTCADYPTWVTACSLAPPAPTITVRIDPVDTVPVGGDVATRITLSPSPLPAGTVVTLAVVRRGAGDVVFDSTRTGTTRVTTSGPVRLRGTAASSTSDDVVITATISGQAAPAASEPVTVTAVVAAFLRFEMHNLATGGFDPLPAGVGVDLMDRDPISDDLVASTTTAAGGVAFFNVSDLSPSGETAPDLFFRVHTDGRRVAGQTLPGTWSTAGWLAADGTPGLRRSFAGGVMGTADRPLVFRIGVDVHVQFTYRNNRTGAMDPATMMVPVEVHSGRVGDRSALDVHIDTLGQVHCVVFDVDPGDDLWLHLDFEMTDPAINLPRCVVEMSQAGWSTVWDDADRWVFPLAATSVGTRAAPVVLPITVNERNDALYMLKILREWQTFFFGLTGGAWRGVRLSLSRRSVSGVAYSWPVGELNIPPADHFDRPTLAHELSHQVMWEEADVSSLGIAYDVIRRNLKLYHRVDLLANPTHALIEGWAEFVEAAFTTSGSGSGTPPWSVGTVSPDGGAPVPLGPPPPNRGESVEGAFSDGLFAIWQQDVLTPAHSTTGRIPESTTGDLLSSATTPLRDPGVRDRFLSMIFNPLKDLRPLSSPGTTDMIAAIRARNPATWHVLQGRLQAFNLAMAVPTITAVTPTGGPPAGGTVITVTGTDLTAGATVTVGGTAATGVTVTSSTSLTATTPAGRLGPADVVVSTAAGAGAPGAFRYADAPTVTAVTDPLIGGPARGTTEGGTLVAVAGTGFDPGARVTFGGTPAGGVTVTGATALVATSPQHCPPGGVDVTVTNPDGQSGTLAPGFDYVLVEPPPRVLGVTPTAGAVGDLLTVTGSGLRPGVRVFLGGVEAQVDPLSVTTTGLRALVGPHPAGMVDVLLRNPDCQEDTVPFGFEYR